MVYNENFIVLDEDEDIEAVENLSEDVLMEGEIVLDEEEEIEILDEAMILSASDIDGERSSKEVSKVKASIDKAISSGKYRAYKSSDSGLIDKTVKSKGMLKTAGMAIAGSIIGAGAGFGASAGASAYQRHDDKKLQGMASKNDKEQKRADKYDAKSAFSGKEFDDYQDEHGVGKKAKQAEKDAKKAFGGLKYAQYAKKHGIKKEEAEAMFMEAMEMYFTESFEYVLAEEFIFNEEGKLAGIKSKASKAGTAVKDGAKDVKDNLGKRDAIAAGAGAIAGGATGAALARKIVSNMRYKVFSYNGLTILSFYTADKEGQAKGNSTCYAIATSTDGNKLLMRRIELKGKK